MKYVQLNQIISLELFPIHHFVQSSPSNGQSLGTNLRIRSLSLKTVIDPVVASLQLSRVVGITSKMWEPENKCAQFSSIQFCEQSKGPQSTLSVLVSDGYQRASAPPPAGSL